MLCWMDKNIFNIGVGKLIFNMSFILFKAKF